MKSPKYLETLRKIAPSIVFETSRNIDETFVWDGAGPDPKKRGYMPFDITVAATTILKGKLFTEEVYLGGSYYKPAQPIGDIYGYLPQMLLECAENLQKKTSGKVQEELEATCVFLKQRMREIYENQREAIAKEIKRQNR